MELVQSLIQVTGISPLALGLFARLLQIISKPLQLGGMLGTLLGEFLLVLRMLSIDLINQPEEYLALIINTPDFPVGMVGIMPGIPAGNWSGIHSAPGRNFR